MISVIVPVYNCEKYITRCVESILKQSYSDYEIILVNDGSTDSSGDICDKLKSRDSRIHVIHKVNGGVSSARNAGLKNAQGDYIAFIDADDWVEPDYLEELSKPLLYKKKIDIVVMPWGEFDEFNQYVQKRHETYRLKKKDACAQLFQVKKWGGWVVWSKLYRRSLFQDFLFREDLCNGEDLVINIELFWKANCFYYVQYSLYHHCMDNSNSLTHRFVLEDMLIFLRALSEYVSVEERRMEETFSDFCRVVADFYIVTIQKMIFAGYDEEKHFKRINEAIGDSLKCVFEYVPKTWLFMLKRELYANPIRSVYEGYLELLGKLNNFENKREKLYIYGAGRKAKRMAVFLARKNINFDSFIVSDGNKLNESPDMKHPVITLSKLMKMANPSDISIILALKDDFAEDVLKTLSIYKFKNILYFL